VSDSWAGSYRIRIDAEGTSASDIERHFKDFAARIEQGTRVPMNFVGQVIEMADNAGAPSAGVWYRGRLTLAPDLTAQGYEGHHVKATYPVS
jgi:hypothetical protein